MSVNNFTHRFEASFFISGQALHARVTNRFESSLEAITGPCEPDTFVGDIVYSGGLLEARHWRLTENPTRHYWCDIEDLGIAANSQDELIAKLNEKFGSDQKFIETLLN